MPPLTAHRPSLEHDEGGPSNEAPYLQPQNDSNSPSVTARPPTVIGCFTQSEVEALFRTFVETHDLTSSTPAPSQSNPSAPAPDPQSELLPHSIWEDPELSPKIREACRVARENGYHYIWIDSCCIDKSSSSELSEAINSMNKWYGLSKMCYAYLADVPPGEDHQAENSAFRKSRWFRRGWTLQEVIAPDLVEFLSEDWAPIASKHTLIDLVESVTKINEKALLHLEPLRAFSVAQRLSWAARRETTRVEDRAYSLLGIFDINMPTLYGEGSRAFRRLQEQIMQRIPDQSVFAWGHICLSPPLRLSWDLGFVETSNVLRARVQQYNVQGEQRHLFAVSPNYFESCEHISTLRHNTFQLPSYLTRHELEYISIPYGIRTQFWMIHLTRDLHTLHIVLQNGDVQLEFPDLPEDSQWYLAILGCEHQEQPGHLLGRICYMSPSDTHVQFVHSGYIRVKSQQGIILGAPPNLLPLSPATIENCRPHTELKTVYIPHPDCANPDPSVPSSLRRQPYTMIKLVLLRETRDALCSQGYSPGFRGSDPDYPTTHWLILSKDGHTITVEFQHVLENGGRRFTVNAEVKMPAPSLQLDSNQADSHIVTWSDCLYRCMEWSGELDHKSVQLNTMGAITLTVDLGLDFAGNGYYLLRVNVLSSSPPASSPVELAVDDGESKEASSSGAIDTENAS